MIRYRPNNLTRGSSNVDAVFELINTETGRITCQGVAQSLNRQCRNSIARSKIEKAKANLQAALESVPSDSRSFRMMMQESASLLLCRYHGPHTDSVASLWTTNLIHRSTTNRGTSAREGHQAYRESHQAYRESHQAYRESHQAYQEGIRTDPLFNASDKKNPRRGDPVYRAELAFGNVHVAPLSAPPGPSTRRRTSEVTQDAPSTASTLLDSSAELECTSCLETKPQSHFQLPTLECKHRAQTCKDCLPNWISARMDTDGHRAVKCPNCILIMSHADIRRCASRRVFERYVSGVMRVLTPSSVFVRSEKAKTEDSVKHSACFLVARILKLKLIYLYNLGSTSSLFGKPSMAFRTSTGASRLTATLAKFMILLPLVRYSSVLPVASKCVQGTRVFGIQARHAGNMISEQSPRTLG